MASSGIVMVEVLVASLGLAAAAWRTWAAVRAGRDARGRGWSRRASVGWGLTALAYPAWYWRQARLERMKPEEARAWLAVAAKTVRLTSVANVRCPLCDAEIEKALAVTAAGRLAIRPWANCPRCDFRLDACRHCQHFLPAQDGMGGQTDMTHGRCGVYRAAQPVEAAYPQMARRLMAMGYDTLNAPKPILDSYVPLDECRRFELRPERLRQNRVRGLDRERLALIRLWQRSAQEGGGPMGNRQP